MHTCMWPFFRIFSIFPSCCTADLRTQCLIVCADCCKAMLLMVYAAFAQQPSKAQGCAHRKKAPLNCVRYPCALSDNPQKALFVMVYAALSQQTLKIRGCAHRKKSPLSACRNGFKPWTALPANIFCIRLYEPPEAKSCSRTNSIRASVSHSHRCPAHSYIPLTSDQSGVRRARQVTTHAAFALKWEAGYTHRKLAPSNRKPIKT